MKAPATMEVKEPVLGEVEKIKEVTESVVAEGKVAPLMEVEVM